jgi:hypothetical protein
MIRESSEQYVCVDYRFVGRGSGLDPLQGQTIISSPQRQTGCGVHRVSLPGSKTADCVVNLTTDLCLVLKLRVV